MPNVRTPDSRAAKRRALGVLTGPVIGLLSAGVALGAGEAFAVFVRPAASPLVAVANKLILLTPSPVERAATQSVGSNDKPDLIAGILVVLAIFAAFLGNLALDRLAYGLGGIAVFGAFGVYCAASDHASHVSDVIPTILATLVAGAVLVWLVRMVGGDERSPTDALPRRSFLQAGTATAVLAALAGFGGRAAQHQRFDVTNERNTLTLPKPTGPTAPGGSSSGASGGPSSAPPRNRIPAGRPTLPRGADLRTGAVAWDTPNNRFYRVDTAIEVPEISTSEWSLTIHGMVDHEMKLSWDELIKRPMIERWITLCCVSNTVGGNLIGNALWQGTLLAGLLREAGVQSGSDQLMLTSADGMTIGTPTKVVMDGRDSLLAIGMNGQPLPIEHGYPVRTIVPGLYGYTSACKWIVDIEATTFASQAAYWVQGGWAQQTFIKLESRIDTPRSGAKVSAGRPVPIAGVAWDQHVGVSKVEVQINNGGWLTARLAAVPSTDTWRQWVVMWTPPGPGSYTIRVRAFDGRGRVQTTAHADPYPSGATGLHTITVQAS